MTYHVLRPDMIVGLITSQLKGLGATDYILQDWLGSGLRVRAAFRSFIVTIPVSANIVRIDQLSERDWQAIHNCLKIAFAALDDPQR